MQLDSLTTFFTTSPSVKLIRSPHAAFIIDFFHRQFKSGREPAKPHSLLAQELNSYLDELHETQPDVLRDRPETYLAAWSTGETRWLRRYFDAQLSEPLYLLTSHTEVVLTFVMQVLDRNRGFVGTESRLSRIIATLSDIAIRGSADRERRVDFLLAERRRIDEELQSIEDGDDVATHSPTAIRERFTDAVSDLISLQGDFRAVEESFKRITRDVQKRHAECIDTRGSILGYALDAEEQLNDEDQGASFHAFVRLILSQSKQDELERMVAQLDEITEIAEQLEGKQLVKGMIGNLSAEAENVLQVTRRLSSTLRRLLDSRATNTRLRLSEVLCEIRSLAVRRAQNPPDIGIDILSDMELLNIHQRTFWESPVEFEALKLATAEYSDDERAVRFRELAETQKLDWDVLRLNIATAMKGNFRTTLPELLGSVPAVSAIEVLGYIQLAHDDGHQVDEATKDLVHVTDSGRGTDVRPYEVPHVVFLSQHVRLPEPI